MAGNNYSNNPKVEDLGVASRRQLKNFPMVMLTICEDRDDREETVSDL
ncbi:MAG: hypothetical protein ACOZAN_04820 [Patescibacteria group bacterium]